MLVIGFVSVSTGVASAAGCTNSWLGGSGDWSTVGGWGAGHVPLATEDVCITVAGTYTMTLGQGATGKSFAIGGSSGTQTLFMSAVSPNTSVNATTGGVTVGARGALVLDGTAGYVWVDVGSALFTSAGGITSQGAGASTLRCCSEI